MEAIGFERYLIIQVLIVVYLNPKRAVEYLLFGISKDSQAEQSAHSATSKSLNFTLYLFIAIDACVAIRLMNILADVIKIG